MKRFLICCLIAFVAACKKEEKPKVHKIQLEIAARLFIIESKGNQGTVHKAERLSGLTSVNENHYFEALTGETIVMSYAVVSPGLINIYQDGELIKSIKIGNSSNPDTTINDTYSYTIH